MLNPKGAVLYLAFLGPQCEAALNSPVVQMAERRYQTSGCGFESRRAEQKKRLTNKKIDL